MATFNQKLLISLKSATLFAIINYTGTFQLTDKWLPFDTFNPVTNCPTMTGQIIHTLVFFLITYLSMGNPQVNIPTKLKNSLYGTLIFFLLSSPAIYTLTSSLFGTWIGSSSGCPTLSGILLHSLVYCLVLVAVMYLPD